MDSNIYQIVNVINEIGTLNFEYISNRNIIEYSLDYQDLKAVTNKLDNDFENLIYLLAIQASIKADEKMLNTLSDEINNHIDLLKDKYHNIRVNFPVPISNDIKQLLMVLDFKISTLTKILDSFETNKKYADYTNENKSILSKTTSEEVENKYTQNLIQRYQLLESEDVIKLIEQKARLLDEQDSIIGKILGIHIEDVKKLKLNNSIGLKFLPEEKDKLNLRQRFYLLESLGIVKLIYSKVKSLYEQHSIIGKILGIHKDNAKKLHLNCYKGLKISREEAEVINSFLSKINN